MRFASLAQLLLVAIASTLQLAWADLSEDAAFSSDATIAATLTGPTDPLPLPVLTSIPGFSVAVEAASGNVAVASAVASGNAVEVEVTANSTIAEAVPVPTTLDAPVDAPAAAPLPGAGAAPVEEVMLEVLEEAPSFSDDFDTGLGAAVTDAAVASAAGPTPAAIESGLRLIVSYWHEVALTMHQRDYSALRAVPDPSQPGPCYTARALAIVHLAIYDALVGVTGQGDTYLDYHSLPVFSETDQPVAAASAVGWAAFGTLSELYPLDTAVLNVAIRNYNILLSAIFQSPFALFQGIEWGTEVSSTIISSRGDDRSLDPEKFAFIEFSPEVFPSGPYQHVPDPTAVDIDIETGEEQPQSFYAPHWGDVEPFGHMSVGALPNPIVGPLDNSTNIAQYLQDFLEVQEVGEDNSTSRTDEETIIGIFWAYDGALRLGSPVRLYAQNIDVIVAAVLSDPDLDSSVLATGFQLARLYAMTHTAMADATVAAWRDKYEFNFWRPIIGIRNASLDTIAGTAMFEEPDWTQLGAPQTNRAQPGINPAFPAYPSGHATIGTAAFSVAKEVLNIPGDKTFTMVSDEFNGINEDSDGVVRPLMTRELTVHEAIIENQDSRVYLGVHWRFDSTTGGILGEQIADTIVNSFPEKA